MAVGAAIMSKTSKYTIGSLCGIGYVVYAIFFLMAYTEAEAHEAFLLLFAALLFLMLNWSLRLFVKTQMAYRDIDKAGPHSGDDFAFSIAAITAVAILLLIIFIGPDVMSTTPVP